jgi:glycosyltransferase involved in cell wall biosynthesis
MTKSNSVSVAIPSIPPRNRLLARAVSSAVVQTHAPESINVALDVGREGAGPTRNRAAIAGQSDWIAFLDDDDVLGESHISSLVEAANETGADLVYPWFTLVGADVSLLKVPDDAGNLVVAEGIPFGAAQREYLAAGPGAGNNFIPVTFLVRRTLFMDLGGFPATNSEPWPYDANEDWGFLMKAARSSAVIHHHPHRTWFWHFHTGSTSGQSSRW